MNSIFHRISVRKYEDKPVEKEKIMEILKAGMQAPSACNQQPWEFYVVTDKEKIQKLSKLQSRYFRHRSDASLSQKYSSHISKPPQTLIYAGAKWKRITMAMAGWKNAAAKYWNNLPELRLSCPQRHLIFSAE